MNPNGTSLRKIRTSTSSKSGANSSPPSTSSRRQSLEQGLNEVATLHKNLSTHSMGGSDGGSVHDRQQAERTSPLYTFLENNNDSWANSLRKPPASKSRSNLSRKQFRENVIQNLWDSMASGLASAEKKPGLKYRDVGSETKTKRYSDPKELTSQYGDPGVDQRPSTSNGRLGRNIERSDIPGVNERGSRRPSSASRRKDPRIPSNREGDQSPAPSRRQRMVDSGDGLSTSATSRRTLRSDSMPHRTSSGVESSTAAVKENGYHGSSLASRREDLTKPSNREGDTSPAPDRRQRTPNSRNELSTSATSRGTLRSESMPHRTSRVVDSRTAAVKENGYHGSSSASRREDLTIPSNRERDTSPVPDRRQRTPNSRNELSTSATSRGTLRSGSMPHRTSRVVDSRTAAIQENGYHGPSSASRREDLTIPSKREGDTSPAPTRRHRIPDSRSELSTSAMARGTLRSESMPHRTSSVTDSRTAGVKENGKHSPNSASTKVKVPTNRSHRDREPSPASIDLRQSTSDSLPRLSTSPTSSRTKRSESMRHQSSSGMESRTAARSESMCHQRSSAMDSRIAARSESMRHQRSSGMDSRTGAVKENGSRRSTPVSRREDLTANPSNRDKEPSPAPIHHPDSRAEMIEFLMSSRKIRRDAKSHSSRRSSSKDSKTGAQVYVPSQGGQEAVRRSSPSPRLVKPKPGSIDGFHLGETLEGAGYNNPISLREKHQGKARPSSTDERKTEPSTSGRIRARLAGSNANLKDEDDAVAADFQNLRTTEPGSTSRRLRQERESDYKPDTSGRSNTSDKNRNSEQENSSAGSGREGSTNRSKTASKRLYTRKYPATYSPKYPATDASLDLPLNKVAAASYNGGSLPFDEMVPFPDDTANLNKFLSDCRRDVEAGVPGKILIAVMGRENSDLDSVVSTIAYAYFLSCKANDELRYYAPVINIQEENFVLHTDAIWLFKASGVDTSNLIFVDQISLLYYHKFGCLRIVLVDHSKLGPQQENLQDAVIAIIDHNVPESVYPWVSNVEIEQVGSCCTLIAEKYASEAPEHLTGRGISRLLVRHKQEGQYQLGTIILDTANLDDKFSRFTTRDEVMAALLIHGAGRYGLQGLFRHLRKWRFDISILSTKDALRKDFKPWTLGPGKTDIRGWKGTLIPAAMSTIGVPLVGLLSRKDIVHDLKRFRRRMKLDLHLIMTGYYDVYDRYHREILVVPKDIELAEQIVTCFCEHKNELRLSSLRMDGLPEEMVVYKQGQVTASRKVIIEILANHFAQ